MVIIAVGIASRNEFEIASATGPLVNDDQPSVEKLVNALKFIPPLRGSVLNEKTAAKNNGI